MFTRKRKSMKVIILPDYEQISRWTANYVKNAIFTQQAQNSEAPFLLGLPTGASVVGVYKELVKLCKEGELSFKNVVSFNMDEYYGLSSDNPRSFAHFMKTHLFDHIDIKRQNIHIFDGLTKDPEEHARRYEEKILQYGSIALFLGGVGINGHLAFNEPFSSFGSRSHLQTLSDSTIQSNAPYFDNDANKVPGTALTVGIQTIMKSDEVLLIASGKKKAPAIKRIIEGSVSQSCPATILQLHRNASIVCDEAACGELKVSTYTYYKAEN